MSLTIEDLTDVFRLVDEIIDCNAQLHCHIGDARRVSLEGAIATRAAKLRAYIAALDGS